MNNPGYRSLALSPGPGWWTKLKLSRQFSSDEHGRRELLETIYPHKVDRRGKGNASELFVDSPVDVFVIKLDIAKAGVCKPLSAMGMKKVQSIMNTSRK